jgi:hypothetical protein
MVRHDARTPLVVDCVTACRACVSANLCPRCEALVRPGAKNQLLDLRGDRPAPKADTLAPRFPVCWVRPLGFSGLEHSPSDVLGTDRRHVLDRSEDRPCASSRHEAVGSSPKDYPRKTMAMRALHRMAFAGTVPPREDSVAGNKTANGQKRSGRRSFAHNGLVGVEDAHGWILPRCCPS